MKYSMFYIETRYSITLAIPERLYEELMRSVPEERLEKVIMDGIAHAIRSGEVPY